MRINYKNYTYDTKTGILVSPAGNVLKAQSIDSPDGKMQKSRFIWLIVHSSLPTGDIDHIDRNRDNNKLENLRDITHQENCINTAHTDSGGAYFKNDKPRNKPWCARIRLPDGTRKILGHYATKAEANAAYMKAR